LKIILGITGYAILEKSIVDQIKKTFGVEESGMLNINQAV